LSTGREIGGTNFAANSHGPASPAIDFREEKYMHVQSIISTHPDVRGNVNESLLRCIEACFDCGQSCVACADACLAEDMVMDLRQCIRLDLDCADVCFAVGKLASRRTGSNEACLKGMIEACAIVAASAPLNVSGMRPCTSIAASLRRPAGNARRPAATPPAASPRRRTEVTNSP
jgi:hypothetical protein